MAGTIANFDRLLVANRGEIALRIMRTARRLGLTTIALYTDADANMPFRRFADEAVRIGAGPVGESYLSFDAVVDAARECRAGAVHPGYGFLSENDGFARAAADAGLVFVGPTPEVMALMGDKRRAKAEAGKAGVAVLPGADVSADDSEAGAEAAEEIGFPLMIKAAAGGGGRGMRRVDTPEELRGLLAEAARESQAAFGDPSLMLEKAVDDARHVEIQILADTYGNCVHLGERDCSLQRRHQKLVEETPAPGVTPAIRKSMGDAAVGLAKSLGYRGAGTVEFILDPHGNFHFLEMNTRLQVEHGVTEMVTGLDLVEWQLRVADGQALAFLQDELRLDGHAIEVRLCAENPANHFLPETGRIEYLQLAEGEGIRIDAGIEQGSEISAHYDSLVAKIMVHADSRETARAGMRDALSQSALFGPATNRDYLIALVESQEFSEGRATTSDAERLALEFDAGAPDAADISAAAALFWHGRHMKAMARAVAVSPELAGWASAGISRSLMTLGIGSLETDFRFEMDREGRLAVEWEGNRSVVEFAASQVRVDGRRREFPAQHWSDPVLFFATRDRTISVREITGSHAAAAQAGEGAVIAPMHGNLVELGVAVGAVVKAGDRVGVMEAMKMRHVLNAPVDGRVATVNAAAGDQISAGMVLAEIEPEMEN